MSPLAEVAKASLAFTGPQGSPAYCGLLFAPTASADRAESKAALLAWYAVYLPFLEQYTVSGCGIALQESFQWYDPTTGEIVADDTFGGGDLDGVGTALETQVSRACGVRIAGASSERVDNRRVRTGWVVPYVGQNAIDANGQVDGIALFSLGANLGLVPGTDAVEWAAWHRPVYERDNDGKRVLVEPGVAYSAGRQLNARRTVAMLRSRRD